MAKSVTLTRKAAAEAVGTASPRHSGSLNDAADAFEEKMMRGLGVRKAHCMVSAFIHLFVSFVFALRVIVLLARLRLSAGDLAHHHNDEKGRNPFERNSHFF